MNRAVVYKILGGLLALAILIQLVPAHRSNPPVTREVRWDSDQTRDVARRACYDCHSNETAWPWYSYVAPVSWLLARDVNEGRSHLNFSEWDRSLHDDPAEIVEVVEEGEMPLGKYVLLHPEARLSDAGRAALVRGLRATLAVDPPIVEQDEDHHR